MRADFRTILVGYTLRLINIDTNNGLVLGAGNFRVHQLEAMVDGDPFSQFLNSCRDRIVPHCHLRKISPQKKKWARTHRTKPRAFEQAVNYTERVFRRQPARTGRFCASLWLNSQAALNFVFTASAMALPSAFLPASAVWAAFITRPMSLMEVAPVSAIVAATTASISSREAACGKYVSITAISACSLSTSS